MFQSICLKNKKLNIGTLCEALLFYQNVSIIAGRDDLVRLFHGCSIRGIERLIKDNRLTVFIGEQHLGPAILPVGKNGKDNVYVLETFSSKSATYDRVLFQAFQRITSNNIPKSIKLVNEFAPLVKPFTYSQSITSLVENDFNNQRYLKQSLFEYITSDTPGVLSSPFDIEINITKDDPNIATNFLGKPRDVYRIESNLPITQIQDKQIESGLYKGRSDVFSGYLLTLLEATGDINTALQLSSEIWTKDLYSAIIKHKFVDLYERVVKSQININEFNSTILMDYHSIGEAVRSRRLPFSEFLKILQLADRFKVWLKDSPDSLGLVTQYYAACAAEGRFDKFPSKQIKFVLTATVGWAIGQYADPALATDLLGVEISKDALSTILGTAFSTLDAFYIDKLIKGWKPNQFVVDTLMPRLPAIA